MTATEPASRLARDAVTVPRAADTVYLVFETGDLRVEVESLEGSGRAVLQITPTTQRQKHLLERLFGTSTDKGCLAARTEKDAANSPFPGTLGRADLAEPSVVACGPTEPLGRELAPAF